MLVTPSEIDCPMMTPKGAHTGLAPGSLRLRTRGNCRSFASSLVAVVMAILVVLVA
jgi:hypothetical protein